MPEGNNPDARFRSWLGGGGSEFEGLYAAWRDGKVPGEPSALNVPVEQQRETFLRWIERHLELVRGFWNYAMDRRAQADLREGVAIALVFSTGNGDSVFAGFSPKAARSMDPTRSYNEGPTVFGEISIRKATPESVLLTTESAAGNVFCVVKLAKGSAASSLSYGTIDAKNVPQCTGGWPE